MKERLRFNPIDKKYKSVTGAVAVNTEVVFNIDIATDFKENGVEFVLFDYETHREKKRFSMELIKEYDDFVKYGVVVSVGEVGLFYYLFYMKGVKYEPWIGITEERKAGLYYSNPIGWQLSVYKLNYEVPQWVNGRIMYHIFVDRFNKVGAFCCRENAVFRPDWGNLPEFRPDAVSGEILNNDFFGGNLQGIIAKLDYLKSLNVGIIILSPIFEAYSNHKYDTGDYMKIDEMFGTEEDFKDLIHEANIRDIRIIFDGVFNHTGADSIYFDKYNRYKSGGAYTKKDSVYADWYHFTHWNERYLCWWNFSNMPTLNGDSPSLKKFFCGEKGVVHKWISLGASGWRLDVVDELKNDMIESIVATAKKENSTAFIIGEVWEDASNKFSYGQKREYFQGKQLDSVMNYPLRNAIIRFVRYGDYRELQKVNFDIHNNYPEHIVNALMNILGTHDTARILTELAGNTLEGASREEKSKARLTFEACVKGKELLKLAVVLQYTLSGFPCVYYGDEAGVQGCNDPFNRTCFPWNSGDFSLTDFYRKLGDIRRKKVFANGVFIEIQAEKSFYLFERALDKERVVIAVNCGDDDKSFFLKGKFLDLLSEKEYCDCIIVKGCSALILECIE